MLSPKWFNHKLYITIPFDKTDFCDNYCDYWEDCGFEPEACPEIEQAKKNYKKKHYFEFSIEEIGDPFKEYMIVDI